MRQAMVRGNGIIPTLIAGSASNGQAAVYEFRDPANSNAACPVAFSWIENRSGVPIYIELFNSTDPADYRASKTAASGNNRGSTFKLEDGAPGLPITIRYSKFSIYFDGAGTFTLGADPGIVIKGWLEVGSAS